MSCANCGCDLRTDGHIHCAVCVCLDLCFVCFADRVEIQDHQADHDYYVLEAMDKLEIGNSWSYAESLRLVDAVAKSGVGAWEALAKLVKTKSPAECQEEFMRLYHGCTRKFSEISTVHAPQKLEDHPTVASPSVPDLTGLLATRGDFDCEWDEQAELTVADLEFTPEDSPQEVQLKLDVLAAYNERVSYRSIVKQFVLERGLCCSDGVGIGLHATDRVHACVYSTPAAAEIACRLAPINRFFESKTQFDEFVGVLVEERRILERLAELNACESTSIPIERKKRGRGAASAVQAAVDSAKKVVELMDKDEVLKTKLGGEVWLNGLFGSQGIVRADNTFEFIVGE